MRRRPRPASGAAVPGPTTAGRADPPSDSGSSRSAATTTSVFELSW